MTDSPTETDFGMPGSNARLYLTGQALGMALRAVARDQSLSTSAKVTQAALLAVKLADAALAALAQPPGT
jgi:hypothetical protein